MVHMSWADYLISTVSVIILSWTTGCVMQQIETNKQQKRKENKS